MDGRTLSASRFSFGSINGVDDAIADGYVAVPTDSVQLELRVPRAVGSYNLKNSLAGVRYDVDRKPGYYVSPSCGAGTLVVSKVDYEGITGTFSFTAEQVPCGSRGITLTNGTFNIQY